MATWLEDAEAGRLPPCTPLDGFVRIAFTHAFGHLLRGSSWEAAVREVLAGHVQGDPQQRLGKPVECHGARLLPYNGDRTSPGELHESKLNTVLGFHVVESIEGGPRLP